MVEGQGGASRGLGGRVWITWEWARSIILAVVLFLGVRAFAVEAFKIPTSSMEGTLLVGDYLLVNKAVYGAQVLFLGLTLPGWRGPGRGEVIVFHPPMIHSRTTSSGWWECRATRSRCVRKPSL